MTTEKYHIDQETIAKADADHRQRASGGDYGSMKRIDNFYSNVSPAPINQVTACVEFIEYLLSLPDRQRVVFKGTNGATTAKKLIGQGSYTMKGYAERWAGHYVSNLDMCIAARIVGAKIKGVSYIEYFDFSEVQP